LAVLSGAGFDLWLHPPGWAWLVLTAVAAFSGSYAIRIPGLVVRLSVSEPIVFLSTLVFGPAPGTITAAADAFAMSLRLPSRLRTPHRILFNVGGLAISVLPSALIYFHLAGLSPRSPTYGRLETFVVPLYIFAVSVFVINSSIVALAVGIERGLSAFLVWRTQFLWLSASYLASAAIAAILVVFTYSFDYALAGLLLPLVVVSFLVLRTTLGRLDDTNRHLSEVNSLYLSTIETLAMAIDAKDQVTHGHIRRVQRFAVGLAKAMGVSEERQLKAIEAAALLHDMGKLAIPEFILNKPGKLTEHEFSVMKTHAAVGADILSSIHFPYPVVPIVRHHHENWDGSGYPDGLKGSEIPIGARILSVVDCYDALTSDRPYRPALSTDDALEILTQRRGRMYDPLVVDIFAREHVALCASAELEDIPAVILSSHHETPRYSSQEATSTHVAHAAPLESLRLLSGLSPVRDGAPLKSMCRQLVDDLRQVAPFDTAALYLADDARGVVEVAYAEGTVAQALTGTRIPIAERLTGWVAAHRTAVWNSDAALDLASIATADLSIGSSLPLLQNGNLIGVLSLYGHSHHEISVGQRRAIESVLPAVAAALGDAASRPGVAIDCTDGVTRRAALISLDAVLSHDRRAAADGPTALVAVSVSPAPAGATRGTKHRWMVDHLVTLLSPGGSNHRCVLTFAEAQFLVCALDGASAEHLEAELTSAIASKTLAGLTVVWSRISTPLELQEWARRLDDVVQDRPTSATPLRVH